MPRIVIFLIGAMSAVAALGQDLLECVNPDVLRGLVFRGEQATVSAAVPPEMTDIDVPGQFSWIGSAERGLGGLGGLALTTVTAAFRANLAPDAARAMALDALAAGGWAVQPVMPGMGGGVFTSTSRPVSQTACREGEAISVTASAVDDRTYVLYATTRGGNSTACDSRMQMQFNVAGGAGLDGQLPSLALPSDPVTNAPARMRGSGSGSSGSGRSERVEFSVDDSVNNVARHFSQQMAEQGWIADASWNGSTTAGSSWSKQPDADTTVVSSLNVTALDEGQFMVVMHFFTR